MPENDTGLLRTAKRSARRVKRFLDGFETGIPDALYWMFRGKTWAEKLVLDQYHPRRRFLHDQIFSLDPFESLAEIGCGSGPNLLTLAERAPHLKLVGIDLNKSGLKVARRAFEERELVNVQLYHGDFIRLLKSIDPVDIILSDGVLMYLPPAKIANAVSTVLESCKRAAVFSEFHCESDNFCFYDDRWVYDWIKVFAKVGVNARFIDYPANLIENALNWKMYGRIMIVEKGI